ncbi:MAG: NTP transferase domain-containing protein, partial [Dermatophilaceae bacterium]
VVGPPQLAQPARPGRPAVSTVLEDPPYGGPVAGLAAGLAAIPKPEGAPLIAVLACDVPRAGRAIPSLLEVLEQAPDSDGARLVDADGYGQNLLAVYRSASLRGAVASADRRGDARGMSMRALVAHLRLLDVADDDGLGFDADTWEAVEALDSILREETRDRTRAAAAHVHRIDG